MSSILIYGPSGHGKSYAIRNLDPKKTFIICSDSKALPFKGWKKHYHTVHTPDGKIDPVKTNYLTTKSPSQVLNALKLIEEKRSDIETVVIDTITHIIIDYYMSRIQEKSFDKFSDLGKHLYDILKYSQGMTKEVIVIGHSVIEHDLDGKKIDKVKTIGKLLDQQVEIPSMFTTVLIPVINRDNDSAEYMFQTQSDGSNAAKSPPGLFPSFEIPNDYQYVLECISAYEQGEEAPQTA